MQLFELTERFARILVWEEGMTFKPWMWWGFGIVASVLIFANWHDSKSDDLQKNDEDELRSKLMREFDDKERDN